MVSTNDSGVLKKLPQWIYACDRPPYLCNDGTPKLDALRDALFFAEGKTKKQYDLIVDLDICNPMRKKEDIDKALFIAKEINHEYPVVSAVKPYRSPYFNQVESMSKIYGSNIVELCNNANRHATRSQDVAETYDINNSIFIYPRSFLADTRNSTVFGTKGRVAMYLMGSETFIDIDEPHHLVACEALMGRYGYD